jgi:hypothetical protein
MCVGDDAAEFEGAGRETALGATGLMMDTWLEIVEFPVGSTMPAY